MDYKNIFKSACVGSVELEYMGLQSGSQPGGTGSKAGRKQ